jgi:hypothetical protein
MIEFCQDINGHLSSKRLLAFALGLLLFLVYASVFFGGMTLTEQSERLLDDIADLLKWIVGFIATEQATKFARGKDDPSPDRL